MNGDHDAILKRKKIAGLNEPAPKRAQNAL